MRLPYRVALLASLLAAPPGVASASEAAGPRPHAVDFELTPPAPERGGARAASTGPVVSPPLRAPRRFNLVGLRWRGGGEPAIAIRARGDDGRWSRWTALPAHPDGGPDRERGERTRTATSSPAWAGEADWVQYRSSRALPGLRLHFVNATGTATPRDRARTALRSVADRVRTTLGATARASEPPTATAAQAGAPPIVPRAAWAGTECEPRRTPEYGEVRAAIIHHTVTLNEYSQEQAPAAILAVCRYHRNSNGWNDIGYNFVVDRFGTIYEGRAGGVDQPVVGAQAQGFNGQSTGIANLGTHTTLPQSDAALSAIARLIRWKLPLHGTPTAGIATLTSAGGETNRFPGGTTVSLNRVSGHRDGNATSCPGDALFAQLPLLRARVGDVQPVAPSVPGLPVKALRTRIDAAASRAVRFPQQPSVRGAVRLVTGVPVSDAPVEVQASSSRGWRVVARTRSGAGGAFAARVPVSGRRVLRARFPGDGERLGSVSKTSVVTVRPTLSAARSIARAAVGRAPVIRGTIGPAKRRVLIVVERQRGGVRQRVATLPASASSGRFRRAFRLRRPGLHRFTVVFTGDSANLPASASPVYVRAVRASGGTSARR